MADNMADIPGDNMTDDSKAVPVQKWAVSLDEIHDDAAAIAGWHALVRAQGWSPVGEPQIGLAGVGVVVVGRLVKYPGLTVGHDIRAAILVPSDS